MHQYTLNNWSNLPLKLPWSGEKISVQFNIQYRSLPWPTLACVIDNNLEENEKNKLYQKIVYIYALYVFICNYKCISKDCSIMFQEGLGGGGKQSWNISFVTPDHSTSLLSLGLYNDIIGRCIQKLPFTCINRVLDVLLIKLKI